MTTLSEIKPKEFHQVYDLVKEVGIDVSDWANFKGGKAKAAANPKYCYEWSFLQPGKTVVLNLWHPQLKESDGAIWSGFNMREHARFREDSNGKRRALNMDHHVRSAYLQQLPIRVVLMDGRLRRVGDPREEASRANKRVLNSVAWAVTEYDWSSGECTIVRGAEKDAPRRE